MANETKQKIDEAIDHLAGAGARDKVAGQAQEALGKIQESVGEALEDRELTARGVVNRADGEGRQAVGEIKSDVEALKERAKEVLGDAARAVREKIHGDS